MRPRARKTNKERSLIRTAFCLLTGISLCIYAPAEASNDIERMNLPDFRYIQTLPQRPEQLIAKIRDKALQFAPGSDRAYSNSGYPLLGLVIEKVSGESYAQFVKENLLDPAGMRDSGYDTHAAVIHHRASGYTYGPDGFENAPYLDMSIPFAAGGLYSTTGDLLRWERALFGGDA